MNAQFPRGAALILALVLAGCGTSPAPSVNLAGCPTAAPTADQAATILADAERAVFDTNKGSFTIELRPDAAPIATANFVALARCGYYAQLTFHRVISGFVVQAGDPQTRSNHGVFDRLGAGGPGYQFEVEFPGQGLAYDKYTVAMANAMQYDGVTGEIQGGTDTNGSQFFIDLANLDARLERLYTIFGKVVEGTVVVDAIGAVDTSGPPRDVPIEPVIIESVSVESAS